MEMGRTKLYLSDLMSLRISKKEFNQACNQVYNKNKKEIKQRFNHLYTRDRFR